MTLAPITFAVPTRRSRQSELLAALVALQGIDRALVVNYGQRLGNGEPECPEHLPRWKRRMKASLRAAQTANTRTDLSIRKLRRYMDEPG